MKKTGPRGAVLLRARTVLIPVSPAGEDDLMVTGDLHLTADGSRNWVLEALAREAENHRAVLFVGDVTNNGHREEHRAFADFLARLSRTGAEIFVLPGNHDLSASFSRNNFMACYASCGYLKAFSRDAATDSCAVRTRRGTVLLMLDTNDTRKTACAASGGWISPATLAWARSVLEGLEEGACVIACGHHPILPYEGLGNDVFEGCRSLAALLKEFGVPVYLCGHRHQHDILTDGALTEFVAGKPDSYPARFARLSISRKGILYTREDLIDPAGDRALEMRAAADTLARNMAEGSLKGTSLEGNTLAVSWFRELFLAWLEGTLYEQADRFRASPAAAMWQSDEIRSFVGRWTGRLLEEARELARRRADLSGK